MILFKDMYFPNLVKNTDNDNLDNQSSLLRIIGLLSGKILFTKLAKSVNN
jgi:hypothetical protein